MKTFGIIFTVCLVTCLNNVIDNADVKSMPPLPAPVVFIINSCFNAKEFQCETLLASSYHYINSRILFPFNLIKFVSLTFIITIPCERRCLANSCKYRKNNYALICPSVILAHFYYRVFSVSTTIYCKLCKRKFLANYNSCK